MIDTAPFEWLLSNFLRFKNEDQKRVFSHLTYTLFLPFTSSYVASSLIGLKLAQKGNFAKKLTYRFVFPLIIAAIVTDASYMQKYPEINALQQELSERYA